MFPFHSRPVGELVLKGQVFRKGGVKVLVFTMYQVRRELISSSWFSNLFLMSSLMEVNPFMDIGIFLFCSSLFAALFFGSHSC